MRLEFGQLQMGFVCTLGRTTPAYGRARSPIAVSPCAADAPNDDNNNRNNDRNRDRRNRGREDGRRSDRDEGRRNDRDDGRRRGRYGRDRRGDEGVKHEDRT